MQTSQEHALASPATGVMGSRAVSPAPAENFGPDVLAYAEQNKLTSYLQPLLEATRNIFPHAEWVKVYYKPDPEAAGDASILYDVRVANLRYPDSWTAQKRWIAELCRICPAPLTCYLTLLLDLADDGRLR